MTDPKTLKVSTAADFAPASEIVELSHAQSGKKLVIRVRQLNMDQLARAEGGPPALPPEPDGTRRIRPADSITAAERAREVARMGIVEPRFRFGDEEGDGPRWDDLSAANQGAAVMHIYRVSGIGTSADVEAATRAATFPAEPGRAGDGAPVRAAVQPAPVAS